MKTDTLTLGRDITMGELTDKMDDWNILMAASAHNELKPTLTRLDFKDRDRVTIVLMGDTHIGSRFYDHKLHQQNLDWCLKEKTPIILMGDNIEAATRFSVGAGVYEQDEIIEKQMEHFYHLYRPLAEEGLILGMHTGNHECRTVDSVGVDVAKIMARELKVPYWGWAKNTVVRVGGQNYHMYTCHGASGARVPTSKLNAAFRMDDIAYAELYAMGHVHLLSHISREQYFPNLKTMTMDLKERHFVLTGHYLTHWGSYAHKGNMEPNHRGSAKLKFHGDEHLIRVSL